MSKKTGILIANLGTPAACTPAAVRHYLSEFLTDPYVIKIPSLIWVPLLRGLIAPLRAKKSAAAYQKIWTAQGSPLLTISQSIVQAIQNQLGDDCHVELGMRYGAPSLKDALGKLQQANINKLIVLPLYPQFSAATTLSTFAVINDAIKKWHYLPELVFINDYHAHPLYLDGLAESIEKNRQYPKSPLLFSFHGLPEKSINEGDPYYFQCLKTAELVAAKLQLAKENWRVVFQSRFGRQTWVQPYCDKVLAALPSQGYYDVDVICPGFAADCLETLEEMAIRNKNSFLAAGGKNFNYIPALNDSVAAITLFNKIIQDRL